MVSDSELKQVMPHVGAAKREKYLPFLQAAMAEFDIDTPLREAAFLAQIAHESGEFRWMEEIWGPTEAQRRYEGRADLGNTRPGDGKRYKGRGPIQLTGRANYRNYGRRLGVDLENEPAKAATPEVGFRIAGLFWQDRGLNALADAGEFVKITRRINGGVNGLADRQAYYNRARLVLSRDDASPEAAAPVAAATVHVRVNEKDLTATAKPFLRDGRILVALRPVAAAAHLRILDTSGGRALLRDTLGANHRATLLIKDGVGYVPLKELPGALHWDEDSRTATLVTEVQITLSPGTVPSPGTALAAAAVEPAP